MFSKKIQTQVNIDNINSVFKLASLIPPILNKNGFNILTFFYILISFHFFSYIILWPEGIMANFRPVSFINRKYCILPFTTLPHSATVNSTVPGT